MPRGRVKSAYPSELYSFRLNAAPDTAQEKAALDSWIAQELPNTVKDGLERRAVAVERIILGLVRAYLGIENPQPITIQTTSAAPDLSAFKAQIMDELKSYIHDVLSDGDRLASVIESRGVAIEGDAFEDDLLDNILEDFIGRQDGDTDGGY